MPARVKLDAYDYSIFGTMDGQVIYISPDALNEEPQNLRQGQSPIYRVRVQIEGAHLKSKRAKPFKCARYDGTG